MKRKLTSGWDRLRNKTKRESCSHSRTPSAAEDGSGQDDHEQHPVTEPSRRLPTRLAVAAGSSSASPTTTVTTGTSTFETSHPTISIADEEIPISGAGDDRQAPAMNGNPPEPDPEPIQAATPFQLDPASHQDDSAAIWQRAYDSFSEDEPQLMGNAEAFLKDQAGLPQAANMQDRLGDVATAQKANFQNKQWRFQWLGKPQMVRDKVESVVELANQWAGLVSAGMVLAPPYVSIPWSAITALLPIMTNDVQEHKAAIDGLEAIARLVLSYQLAEAVLLGQGATALEAYAGAVLDLYKLVLEYQVKAIDFFGKSTLRRLGRNAMGSTAWKDMPGSIAAKDTEVRRSLDFKAMEDQKAGFSSLSEVLQRQEEKIDNLIESSIATTDEVREIMAWVSSIPVETDHADVRLKLGESHHTSGQWFLDDDQVKSWMTWGKGCRHLWLRDGMGTGKSSLTSVLVEKLVQSPDGVVAIFYCSKKIDEWAQAYMQRNRGVNVIRGLLAQSAVSTDGTHVYEGIKQRYRRDKRRALSGFALSSEDCLILLSEMISNQPHIRFTIAVDALDECEDYDELLELLQRLPAADNLRFFFSSRLEVKVKNSVPSAKDITILSQNSADIDRFLDVEIPRRRDECGITDAQVFRLRYILRSRANGMFLWVKIQLNRFLDPIKRNRIRLESDIAELLQALEEFPATGEELLKAAYDDEYNRATAFGREPGRVAAVVSALRWVLSAFRPLTLKELAFAVSVNHGTDPSPRGPSEGHLLEFCSNFIVEDTTGIMQLAHMSARHCLEARIPPEFLPGAAHLEAALTSLYFRRSPYNDESLFQKTQVVQRGDFALTKGFYEYVTTYWWSHCQLAQDNNMIEAVLEANLEISKAGVKDPRDVDRSADTTSSDNNFVHNLLNKIDSSFEGTSVEWHKQLEAFIASNIAQNVNLASTDTSGNTALHHIVRQHLESSIELLIRGGAPIDARNDQGNTALHLTAMFGLDRGAQFLLQSGATRHCRNSHGETPLHFSIIFGHLDVFETLFSAGVDVLAQDHHRNSPFHVAAQWDCEDAMKILLSEGYSPNGVNDDGDTALSIAIKAGYKELIRILLRHGAHIREQDAENARTRGLAEFLVGNTQVDSQVPQVTRGLDSETTVAITPGSPVCEHCNMARLISTRRGLPHEHKRSLKDLRESATYCSMCRFFSDQLVERQLDASGVLYVTLQLRSDTPWEDLGTDMLSLSIGKAITLKWELCYEPLTGKSISERWGMRIFKIVVRRCNWMLIDHRCDTNARHAMDHGPNDSTEPFITEYNQSDSQLDR